MDIIYIFLFIVYSHYKNTKCNERGTLQRQLFYSLSEAKSACNNQSACEMVEIFTQRCEMMNCGGNIEDADCTRKIEWTCGPYYRTCSGGLYHPIGLHENEIDSPTGMKSLSEVWLKGYRLNIIIS